MLMKFSYKMTLDDLDFYNHYAVTQSASLKRRFFWYGVMIFAWIVFLMATHALAGGHIRWSLVINLSLIGFLGLAIMPYLSRRAAAGGKLKNLMRTKEKTIYFLGDYEVNCNDQTLDAKNDKVESKYKWECFTGFEETPAYLILKLTLLSALVINKASIQSPFPLAEIISFLKQKISHE